MRRWLENLELFAIDVILERRYGKRAALLRWLLWTLSWLFRGIVQARLWLYRKRALRDSPLGCLVISVGNLTVGGTGKTPVVETLARTLHARGRRVAILSRGYKSRKPPIVRRLRARWAGQRVEAGAPRVVSDGKRVLLGSREAGDEPFMLASNLPGVVVLVDKDRVKAGRWAVEHFGADTLILDDGLQYLRLQHRLDLVLVDRQAPFGNEYLLPRGTLREPPRNLRRASHIFITKSKPEPASNDALIARIRGVNRTAEIIECTHRPQILREVFTRETLPLEALQGRYIGALSAIATPESFEEGLRGLGAHVELSRRFLDHHRFRESELRAFSARCHRRDVAMIVTTEKDAVRFPRRFLPPLEVPIYFLRVEIEILRGQENWEECVTRVCEVERLWNGRAVASQQVVVDA
ncbi:MAG: tetraacyldisaccharide 4'-kinase [Verrucomicrobia bacterium]|nr:tetraacyldisaccharide 4'-kinase [Verrucomicrobiota bacterium]